MKRLCAAVGKACGFCRFAVYHARSLPKLHAGLQTFVVFEQRETTISTLDAGRNMVLRIQ